MTASVHASAVLVGARAVLIRGPSGSGKSRLVLRLLQACDAGALVWARLVADDRVILEPAEGRVVVRAPAALRGLLEMRGVGLCKLPFEAQAVLGLVVDLSASAERLPEPSGIEIVPGVTLPRLAISPCADPLPVLLTRLQTRAVNPMSAVPSGPPRPAGAISADPSHLRQVCVS
jgi:HPr kinase/phosphorylase